MSFVILAGRYYLRRLAPPCATYPATYTAVSGTAHVFRNRRDAERWLKRRATFLGRSHVDDHTIKEVP